MLQKRLLLLIIAAGFINAIGCATLPVNTNRITTYAYTDTAETTLGQSRHVEKSSNPGKSGFMLLSSGVNAFAARARLAYEAEKSIDVQYYLLHDDLTGKLFIDQLLKAADRGVRVRLLLDDMGLEGKDIGLGLIDSHPNIEVRIFNPFSRETGRILQFITRLGSVTRRMHNKSFTVDNQVTILGGRNIGDAYFGAEPGMAFFDLDVLAIGPVVASTSYSFDRYWNNELAYPALTLLGKAMTPEEVTKNRQALSKFVDSQMDSTYLLALKSSDVVKKLRENQVNYHWGVAEVIFDQPEKISKERSKTEFHLAPKLKPYLDDIAEELIIFSPYFVPGKWGTNFLTRLAARGVSVRIVTNSLSSNDVGVVHAGYAKYRKALLRGGVEIYEMNMKVTRQNRKNIGRSSQASLHAKSFVFDRNQMFIGSLNLDPRSIIENTEIGVVFASSEIAAKVGNRFDQIIDKVTFRLELKKNTNGTEKILWHGIEDGKPVTFNVDPHTSFWQRFGIRLLGILPIESQL